MSYFAELPTDELTDLVAGNPEQLDLRLALVEHFVRKQELDIALSHAEAAEQMDPGNPDVVMWKSMCLIFLGQLETGHETLQRVIRNNPCCDFQIRLVSEVVPLFTGVHGDPSQGSWLSEVANFERDGIERDFVERTSSFMEAVDLLQDDNRAGISALTEHLARYPADVNARLYLAIAYCGARQFARANEQYREVIRMDPECATACFDLAAIVGDPREAVELTRAGLAVCPHASHARYNLGVYLIQAGEMQQARRELSRIPADNPAYVEALVAIGLSWEEEYQYPRAAECLERAVALRPDRADIRGKFGQLLCECGWHDKAMKELEYALELDARQYCVWANKGLLHLQFGEEEQALLALQKSLEINPQSAEAAVNLAVLVAERGDIDKAIEILEQAIHYHPEHALICQNLGAFYCNRRMVDQALFYTDRAIELGIDSPTIYWNMANIYCYQGQRDLCLKYLRRAIERDHTYATQFRLDPDFQKYWDDPEFIANCQLTD